MIDQVEKLYRYKAHLLRIVDGDTIKVEIDLGFGIFHRCTVRMYGIDTPECRTRNKFEKTWGLAAKYRLVDILSRENRDFVLQTSVDKKGKFGRVLGTVFLNDSSDLQPQGTNVNRLLVKENLAIPYMGGDKDKSRDQYSVRKLWETTYHGSEENG
jgi:micrococcal nuclease